MTDELSQLNLNVHCRVGSLETIHRLFIVATTVHCRVGSLEIISVYNQRLQKVHCRVGCIKFARSIFNVLLWLI